MKQNNQIVLEGESLTLKSFKNVCEGVKFSK